MKSAKPLPSALGVLFLASIGLVPGLAPAQVLVSDFSNFSESGNLLGSPNVREQAFTPSGTSVTVTSAASHANGVVGQEAYLSDEFPALTAGDRVTVDLTAATFNLAPDTIGLAVASMEALTSRTYLLIWGWRTGSMYLANFGGVSGTEFISQLPAFPGSGRPDSVFIERTATGWTFGSIKGATETIHFTNITAVGTSAITANGTAIGLFSDMRTDTSTWTVNHLVVGPLPPPVLRISQSGGALDFQWDSKSTRQYDLVSSIDLSTPVSTWPPYNDGITTHENIAASGTGTNSLTGVQKVGPQRFFSIIQEPVP